MPDPANLFTDSVAKHLLSLLLNQIRLISVVQMIARMFVMIKVVSAYQIHNSQS